jgi:hypothetical protein
LPKYIFEEIKNNNLDKELVKIENATPGDVAF